MIQQPQIKRIAGLLMIAGFAATLAACGGGSDNNVSQPAPPAGPVAGATFAAKALVSDIAGAATTTDASMINAWGLAFNPTGASWVVNDGTSTSTLYDGNGVKQNLVVSINPGSLGVAKPTGIVFTGSATDFKISSGGNTGPSRFIFSNQAGTIAAWAPTVDGTHALTIVDNAAKGSVYKGLAIANAGGANMIYATDFKNNHVDVFDANFNPVALPADFKDPAVPAGFAPFGIQAIGNSIFVTYAKQDATGRVQVKGAGLGMVSQFDTSGKLIKDLVLQGGALNAPWGLAVAPANFGSFSNNLLVGNFGDGKINAFDINTGKALGSVSDSTGAPLVLDGLWALQFGNGVLSQPTNTLFYTAGPQGATHGQYGRVDFVK
ncbi:TIGR03118 family protein [Janthinobacterium agaricidamnosum]|uniref:TIGR03118 family protein n=1 Tax=Janthinobacterium agaricidamnosum NBRC 102515 = DSM 9628 TaxID=1349767 RepID=W0V6G7_9BURK|nr:TIGR03118 family protein [Janthinobacterium agaricidamnosum]CDG82872.1 putative uncharacterized protein [Janthinobacterium agaricidamnosum NBRC 102515 = DSM 9628]